MKENQFHLQVSRSQVELARKLAILWAIKGIKKRQTLQLINA